MRLPRAQQEHFMKVWNESDTPQEVASAFGLSAPEAMWKATYLRGRGMNLKKFKPGNKPGYVPSAESRRKASETAKRRNPPNWGSRQKKFQTAIEAWIARDGEVNEQELINLLRETMAFANNRLKDYWATIFVSPRAGEEE